MEEHRTQALQQARLLYQLKRYAQAETVIRQYLSQAPEDYEALTVLAYVLRYQKKLSLAEHVLQRLLQLYPERSWIYQEQSRLFEAMHKFEQAAQSVQTALQLDATSAATFAQLAHIYNIQEKHQAALKAAQDGLALDAEQPFCLSEYYIAAAKLNLSLDTDEAVGQLLASSPANATMHNNCGWFLLEENQPKKALPYFREALALNPELIHAQAGLKEALKRGTWLFRCWNFWQKSSAEFKQGAWIVISIIATVLAAYLTIYFRRFDFLFFFGVLVGVQLSVLLLTVMYSWTILPFSIAYIALFPQGRLTLSSRERTSAVVSWLLLALTGSCILWAFLADSSIAFYCASITLLLPVATFWCMITAGKNPLVFWYSVFATGAGLLMCLLLVVWAEVSSWLFVLLFYLALLISQLVIKRDVEKKRSNMGIRSFNV